MEVKDPKDLVSEIVHLVGKPEAQRLLITEKISPSTAGQLINGRYKSAVGELIADAIKRAFEASKIKAS